jgi:hypothetical protein
MPGGSSWWMRQARTWPSRRSTPGHPKDSERRGRCHATGGPAHVMRNELVEELVPDLVGENGRKPDAALFSSGRTSRRGSEIGKT